MSKIIIENQGNIAVLTLNNGSTNAISQELVDDISKALDEIRNHAQGMVLCGGNKFFSIGLDLSGLIGLNRSDMADFWHKTNQFLLDLYTFSLPTVCAICGHAVAGGNVLALSCDYRFATEDEKKIGLNEIKLGVPVPYLADMVLKQIVGEQRGIRMLYSGEFMLFSEAKQMGLIDERYPTDQVRQRAVEKAAQLSALGNQAFSAVKENHTEEIKQRYEKNQKAKNEAFLDCWFSEPIQRILKEASGRC